MDAHRFWPALGVFLMTCGAMWGAFYLRRVDAANDALMESRQGYEIMLQSLVTARKQWSEAQEKTALWQRIQATEASIGERESQLETLQRAVEADLKYLATAVGQARVEMAAQTQSRPIPSVLLKSGIRLSNAKFSREQDSKVSIVHSDGISQVEIADLPEDLVAQFDLGANSMRAQLESLVHEVGLAPNADTSKQDAQVRSDERKLRQLAAAYEAAQRYRMKLEREVMKYDAEIEDAEAQGQLTTALRALRDLAEGRAGEARLQVAELEKEFVRLRTTAGQLNGR